jgi:predicted 3-demethylubiquinone-9 3-methyltransferase (glyoxalase superfamily)
MGHEFKAISDGPEFKLNPSISFMVNFDPSQTEEAEKQLNSLWGELTVGGKVLMALDKYDFSPRYGWVEDKYGVSWQLMLTNPEGEKRPLIIPSMLFTQERAGKAKEATDFYISVFNNSGRGTLAPYPEETENEREGSVMFTDFKLENQWFAAMDSAQEHGFGFNEAISLMIMCDSQNEINYYWGKLSAVPEAEQCGWLKDKYGVSWQVVPRVMDEMTKEGTEEQIKRMTQAFLPMKKLEIETIRKAYKGKG